MIRALPARTPHLSDGDLGRLLDGEATHWERECARSHLAECIDCAGRLESVEDASADLAELLGAAEVSPPPVDLLIEKAKSRRVRKTGAEAPWSPLLRAAAVVILVAGGSLTVSPLRAWIAETWQDIAVLFTEASFVADEEIEVSVVQEEDGSVVFFLPAGEDFLIDLDHHQTHGAVSLRLNESHRGAARIVGARGEDLFVLSQGIRVRNGTTSSASYEVALPSSVTRATLRIGGEIVGSVVPRELPAGGVEIGLARP